MNTLTILYCRSGNQNGTAVNIRKQQGIANAINGGNINEMKRGSFKMKNLLINWTVMRGIRMALGIIILIQAIIQKDAISGIFAGVLMITAFANVGCCSASAGCTTNNRKKNR